MSPPTITVVITTYNHAIYLARALDSLVAQTRPLDQLLVVDDASTDRPDTVVANYASARLIRHPRNLGLSSARNTGLRDTTSEFVLFLDADDFLFPGAIEVLETKLAQFPEAGLSYGGYRFVDSGGSSASPPVFTDVGADAFPVLLKRNAIGMHGAVLYRTDQLRAAGGFDPSLNAAEDYDLFLRLARSHRFVGVPEVVAGYRQHDTNMSNNAAKMLAAVHTVLARQRTIVADDPLLLDTWREGMRGMTQLYVGRSISLAIRSVGSERFWRRLSTSISLTSSHPIAAIRWIWAKMAEWAQPNLRPMARWYRRRRDSATFIKRLRRTTPLSNVFGFDRGKPVDRYYIETVLKLHASDISGAVLEFDNSTYTRQFGSGVEHAYVFGLHPDQGVDYHGDLGGQNNLPAETFDCIIFTQTLHLIYDMPAAISALHRALKTGGRLLVTVPWVSPIDRSHWHESWYWSISPAGMQRLLSDAFGSEHVEIRPLGNVLAATAFLYGLAEEELGRVDLQPTDPFCPVIVSGRAVK